VAKNKTADIDKTLADLYTSAKENFNDKLQVAKLMVTIECARLKATEGGGDDTPEGLKD